MWINGGAKVGESLDQLTYLGEFSCAKQLIVCTGLSFNLWKNIDETPTANHEGWSLQYAAYLEL